MLRGLGAETREVRVPERSGGPRRPGHPRRREHDDREGDRARRASRPAIRAHHAAGRPVFGTCAGMIVCDDEHLGLIDASAERNAFGRQLQSFEADLEVEGIGDEPLRAVFIRAPWVAPSRPGCRGASVLRGSSGGDPRRRRAGLRLPPRADRRPAAACPVHGDDDNRARARARLRGGGELRDPRAENLAKILVGYSTKVKEGDVVVDRRRERRRAAAAGDLRGGAEGGRQPDPERRARRPVGRLLQARLRRPARVGLAVRRSGWSRTPTSASRSAPAPTPRELSGGAARAPDPAPGGDRRADGAGDEAQRRGRLPLVLHALPDQRLRLRGRDEPGRLRGLLLRRLPGRRRRPAHRLEAGLGGDASACPSGSRATRRSA